jgi:hypothetical protein
MMGVSSMWIESHETLGAHPKTRKLAHLLGVSKVTAIGHLHVFWWWALNYAQDGDLSRWDVLDIAIGAEWDGDPDLFVDAMTKAGFLEDDGLIIHDWHDYAGKLIARRKANAERMRQARAEQEDGTSDARVQHVRSTQRACVERPNQTKPNQTEEDHNESERADALDHSPLQDRLFERFWNAYPRKTGKGAARKVWSRLKPGTELVDRMLVSVAAQKRSAQWLEGNGKFIPHPATWLNQERWEDEPEPGPGQGPVDLTPGRNGYSSEQLMHIAQHGFHEGASQEVIDVEGKAR